MRLKLQVWRGCPTGDSGAPPRPSLPVTNYLDGPDFHFFTWPDFYRRREEGKGRKGESWKGKNILIVGGNEERRGRKKERERGNKSRKGRKTGQT